MAHGPGGRQSAVACPSLSVAQTASLGTPRTTVTFHTENDDWPPDTGTDKNYTNGFRLSIARDTDALRLHRFWLFSWVPVYRSCADTEIPTEPCISTTFSFGQQFYTPDDITVAELQPRPALRGLVVWRGNVAGGQRQGRGNDRHQRGFHRRGLARTAGPDQLAPPGEPPSRRDGITRSGIGLGSWLATAAPGRSTPSRGRIAGSNSMPFVGGHLGNIVTEGYGGGRIKIGYNITRDGRTTPSTRFVLAMTSPGRGCSRRSSASMGAAISCRMTSSLTPPPTTN